MKRIASLKIVISASRVSPMKHEYAVISFKYLLTFDCALYWKLFLLHLIIVVAHDAISYILHVL